MPFVVSVNGVFKEYSLPDRKNNTVRRGKQKKQDGDSLNDKNPQQSENKKNLGAYQEVQTQSKNRPFIHAYEIMSSPVKTLSQNHTVKDAINLMQKEGFRHIPILGNNILVGIVSDRNLFSQNLTAQFLKTPLSLVMSKEVIVAKEHSEIKVLGNIMLCEHISSLPIINEDNILQGIVTQTDLLNYMVQHMPIDFNI